MEHGTETNHQGNFLELSTDEKRRTKKKEEENVLKNVLNNLCFLQFVTAKFFWEN
jgi:hypothetical protein